MSLESRNRIPINQNGSLCSIPLLTKSKKSIVGQNFITGASGCIGNRSSNEDSLNIRMDCKCQQIGESFSLLGVFDGHGGSKISEEVSQALFQNIVIDEITRLGGKKETRSFSDNSSLTDSHFRTDRSLFVHNNFDLCGSCACSTIIVDRGMGKMEIIAMSVGDSKCVLYKNGRIIEMSQDKKPDVKQERERIIAAKGYITHNGYVKLSENSDQGIAVSRAFGDYNLKMDNQLDQYSQIITCQPEINREFITKGESELDFMIIGCDGIFEKTSVEKVVKLVKHSIELQLEYQETKNPKKYFEYRQKRLTQLLKSKANVFDINKTNIIKSITDEYWNLINFRQQGIDLALIASDVINECILDHQSNDNTSLIIVLFNKPPNFKSTLESGLVRKDIVKIAMSIKDEYMADTLKIAKKLCENSQKWFSDDFLYPKNTRKRNRSSLAERKINKNRAKRSKKSIRNYRNGGKENEVRVNSQTFFPSRNTSITECNIM